MSDFQIKDKFYLDGKPFQIISGAIHYFRVIPEYWQDRLEKLKNMGCNTVETYIPWNFHEPKKGQFVWDGMHDVEKFIQIAQDLGLYLIIRPSPFICAEWEAGGLPSWLFAEPGMKLRCSYKPYLDHIKDYYKVLMPKLVPHQIDHGGNIILMQIENEYGYYGDDAAYLEYLANLSRELGITVPFVTSDGPWGLAFKTGQLKGALPTGNFGTNCEKQFGVMKPQMQGEQPLMCMEFWAGWFDAWGNPFKMRSVLKWNKKDFEYTIKNGHNINIYMFHGGTNFGFTNGANYYAKLMPDTTSYDYDAPLSEDGTMTKKYEAFRSIVKKYKDVPDVKFSTPIKKVDYGTIPCTKTADLFTNLNVLSEPQKSVSPLSMEEAGQTTGYIMYQTRLNPQEEAKTVTFKACNDRVQAYAGRTKVFTAYDKEITKGFHYTFPFTIIDGKVWKLEAKAGEQLSFLVENVGRVNFGHKLMNQKKGITDDVIINGHEHYYWDTYTLPLDAEQYEKLLTKADWKVQNATKADKNPGFFMFEFDAEETGDTFWDFKGWGKGCAFVNGFNIGRFYNKGPQKALYIPGPLLKKGKNTIVIFETEGLRKDSIRFTKTRKW